MKEMKNTKGSVNAQGVNIIKVAQANVNQVYSYFGSNKQGLSQTSAAARLKKVGPNTISASTSESKWKVFFKNFISPMAILLWVSGFIAIFSGTMELGIAIWAVNIINGLFSFWQENEAKKSTDALKNMLPTYVTTLRDGKEIQINAVDMVPGDVFELQAGNAIPADARIISSNSLQVDESSLTGESLPVSKKADYKHGNGKFAEQNIVFAGTTVTNGSATAVAYSTGQKTEFGNIAKLTNSQQKAESPLMKELDQLTKQLSKIAIGLGIAFFVLAIFFVHYPAAKAFIFALGMVVAFIPEGLLPTVTLSLAQGTKRMAKKNALVKDLNSVETLGETSVICSDKTGTLTQNQMTINNIWFPNEEYTVTGTGYYNNGKIQLDGKDIKVADHPDLKLLLTMAVLDNDTQVQVNSKNQPSIIGTPTEAALNILTAKAGVSNATLGNPYRMTELPFDSDRKRMSVVMANKDGSQEIYTKGALDSMLTTIDKILVDGKVRPITDADIAKINKSEADYAQKGLRALAFAYRDMNGDNPDFQKDAKKYSVDSAEKHLTFVGLTPMSDPPRPEIYDAVKKCHNASIKIIMVTGDSPLIAKSVATKIGIVSDKARVITGDELSKMSDSNLQAALQHEVIFARVAPEDKYRIVQNNQALGRIVASTGDGVNDAPALKKADIGVAMGATGTDVAKEAADMILTDDNFASIVAAIEEGRAVYSNIQKFLLYILNSNVPEALPSVLFLFSRGLIPLPLTVMQILTIDLGTDMLPALGLGSERAEPGIMNQPPRSQSSHLLNKSIIWKAFGWYGLVASVISAGAYFFVNYAHGWPHVALASSGPVYVEATTMTLAAIIFCQIAAVINCRTDLTSVFKIGIFSNHRVLWGIVGEIFLLLLLMYVPFLRSAFNTMPIGPQEWLFLICIPIPLVLIEEIRKFIVRKVTGNNTEV